MPDEEPLDIIASRILEGDGTMHFHIRIGRPKLVSKGNCWFCRYGRPTANEEGAIRQRGRHAGADPRAHMLAVDVEFPEESEHGRLSWLESKDFGLLLPPAIQPSVEIA